MDSNQNNPNVQQRIAQGVTAWEGDDYKGALSIFETVLTEHTGFADVHNKGGLCRAMLGELEGALRAFDKALEIAPDYAEAHLNRGIVLNELGRHDEAREAFDEAKRLDTRHGTEYPSDVGNRIAVTHAQLGDLYMTAEHPAEAAEQYRAALRVRPRFLDIRSKLAEALVETGDLGQARKELETVLEKNPGFTTARVRLGVVLKHLGDREGAAREWRRAAEEAPGDMRARAYLAGLEGKEGNKEEKEEKEKKE